MLAKTKPEQSNHSTTGQGIDESHPGAILGLGQVLSLRTTPTPEEVLAVQLKGELYPDHADGYIRLYPTPGYLLEYLLIPISAIVGDIHELSSGDTQGVTDKQIHRLTITRDTPILQVCLVTTTAQELLSRREATLPPSWGSQRNYFGIVPVTAPATTGGLSVGGSGSGQGSLGPGSVGGFGPSPTSSPSPGSDPHEENHSPQYQK